MTKSRGDGRELTGNAIGMRGLAVAEEGEKVGECAWYERLFVWTARSGRASICEDKEVGRWRVCAEDEIRVFPFWSLSALTSWTEPFLATQRACHSTLREKCH